MEGLTYRQLRDRIDAMTQEQQDLIVTVFDRGEEEFFMVMGTMTNPIDDVLTEGYPYLVFNRDFPTQ